MIHVSIMSSKKKDITQSIKKFIIKNVLSNNASHTPPCTSCIYTFRRWKNCVQEVFLSRLEEDEVELFTQTHMKMTRELRILIMGLTRGPWPSLREDIIFLFINLSRFFSFLLPSLLSEKILIYKKYHSVNINFNSSECCSKKCHFINVFGQSIE